MAFTVIDTNIVVLNTDAFVLTGIFSSVFVAPGVLVAAESTIGFDSGIRCAAGFQQVIVAGAVAADSAIETALGTDVDIQVGGVVAGDFAGIEIGDDQCDVHNAGSISGKNGIYSNFAARIWNSGTITGIAALGLSDFDDFVVNSGTMIGDVLLRVGSDIYDGSGGKVLGTIDLGDGNDTATGGDLRELFVGGRGADDISGAGGDDEFRAILTAASDGDDTLDGGSGIDFYNAASAVQSVTIDLAAGLATGFEIGTDDLTGIEKVRSGSGDDRLIGGAKADTLISGDGADSLSGGGGDDRLIANGALGAKTMDGGTGNDRLTGGDTGRDSLAGGDGNDVIWARYDTDILAGGAGADRFVYKDVEELFVVNGPARERIADFQAGTDLIDLSTIPDTYDFGAPVLDFIGNAAFSAVGQVRFEVRGGNTYVQLAVYTVGVTGELRLDGIHALTAADFLL
jgi:Ca2+-binding RTX toxin-like protein